MGFLKALLLLFIDKTGAALKAFFGWIASHTRLFVGAGLGAFLIWSAFSRASVEGTVSATALGTALILIGGGVLCFGIACLVWVAFRFLTIAITLDAQMAREFGAMRTAVERFYSVMKPDEGRFIPGSEEREAEAEQEELMRRQGLEEDQIQEFLKQAHGEQA